MGSQYALILQDSVNLVNRYTVQIQKEYGVELEEAKFTEAQLEELNSLHCVIFNNALEYLDFLDKNNLLAIEQN